MNTFLWILLATVIDGLLAFVGIFTFFMKKKTLKSTIFSLVAFSAGALMAGGLFHMLLEGLEKMKAELALSLFLLGFLIFFAIERVLKWRHCHEEHCDVHPMTSLVVIGDSVHNIVDGLVVAAAFIVSVRFGIITSLMLYLHEIPQELGNFSIMVYGGEKRKKALLYNFLAQLTCIIGGIIGYFFSAGSSFSTYMLPIAAGGFIYISASDLIPELHKEADLKKSMLAFGMFVIGMAFMLATKFLLGA
ncbi:MAG: ZIP family metal transporter [Candidatus Woesearchaeota archaeon]|nr:ZIP family metal transporter [Candidatus Woesearchaeota archaeon]